MDCIKQFRYYGERNENNLPLNLTFQQLIRGDFITKSELIEEFGEIQYLKITTFSGIEFNINDEDRNITMTPPNVFELNSDNFTLITSFKFINNVFLQRLAQNLHEGDFIIIDVIYSKEVKE